MSETEKADGVMQLLLLQVNGRLQSNKKPNSKRISYVMGRLGTAFSYARYIPQPHPFPMIPGRRSKPVPACFF